jgi:hypothetical protein
MSHPCPHHCPSPRKPSGLAVAAVLFVAVVVLGSAARSAASAALDGIIEALEIIGIVLACAVVLTGAGAAAWMYRRHARQRQADQAVEALPAPDASLAIEAPARVIEGIRFGSFHGMSQLPDGTWARDSRVRADRQDEA